MKEESKSNFGDGFFANQESYKEANKKDVENLENEVQSKKESANKQDEELVLQLKDALARSIAECENLKKRHQKEIESTAKYGSAKILQDLAEPFDQLFLALSFKPSDDIAQNPLFQSIVGGIEMTRSSFEKAFAKHGLKRIYPKGEKFNHNHHQAISQVKQEGLDSGIVIEVVQAGYILEDRVLKPAMVVVSA